MDESTFAGQHVVVTGGGNGIGKALAEAFAAGGARVTVADRRARLGGEHRRGIGGLGVACDVGDPAAMARLVETAVAAYGPIDVFCSNAGFSDPRSRRPGAGHRRLAADRGREPALARVGSAARGARDAASAGAGKLLQTISSAALITGPSGPGYTLTKHGALGFAEWLSLRYGDDGIGVTCLCPNAVYTGMFGLSPDQPIPTTVPAEIAEQLGEVLLPADVAAQAIAGTAGGPFPGAAHIRGSASRSCARRPTTTAGWTAPGVGCIASGMPRPPLGDRRSWLIIYRKSRLLE